MKKYDDTKWLEKFLVGGFGISRSFSAEIGCFLNKAFFSVYIILLRFKKEICFKLLWKIKSELSIV